MQKRPIILRSLLMEATLYLSLCTSCLPSTRMCRSVHAVHMCTLVHMASCTLVRISATSCGLYLVHTRTSYTPAHLALSAAVCRCVPVCGSVRQRVAACGSVWQRVAHISSATCNKCLCTLCVHTLPAPPFPLSLAHLSHAISLSLWGGCD